MRPSGDRPDTGGDRVRHVTFTTTTPTTTKPAGSVGTPNTTTTTTATSRTPPVEKVAAAPCPEFVELGLGEPTFEGMGVVEDSPAPAATAAAGATAAAAPSPRRLHDPPTHHDVINSSHRGVPPPAVTTPPHPVEARTRGGGGGGGGARGGGGGGRVLLVPVDGLRRGLATFPVQLNFPETSPKTNQRCSSLAEKRTTMLTPEAEMRRCLVHRHVLNVPDCERVVSTKLLTSFERW